MEDRAVQQGGRAAPALLRSHRSLRFGPDRTCPAGRPRASPEPTVLLGDRAAVPCRPATRPERGPTTHGTIRTSHRSGEPRVVLSGPPLADTDTGTNGAIPVPVTRRTGEKNAYVCPCDGVGTGGIRYRRRAGTGGRVHGRAGGWTYGPAGGRGGPSLGFRSCRGRAPAGSSRARCPACPGRPCSDRGSPSRGRDSRVGRRKRSVPAG